MRIFFTYYWQVKTAVTHLPLPNVPAYPVLSTHQVLAAVAPTAFVTAVAHHACVVALPQQLSAAEEFSV